MSYIECESTATNIHDTKSECFEETINKYPSIQGVRADTSYRKTMVEISEKITPVWSILPKRWVVERTFS